MAPSKIEVMAPSRLHFGLIDLSLKGYRIDGGVGLALKSPNLKVTIHKAEESVNDSMKVLLQECAAAVGADITNEWSVTLEGDLRRHVGLGSGTQLRLALAAAALACVESTRPLTEVAPALGRAGTSGIGSWGFWLGGVLADGGHDRSTKGQAAPSSATRPRRMPPLMHRGSFPWITVVAIARGLKSVFGDVEKTLFQELTPVPKQETAAVYALTYGQLLPAAYEKDFNSFCSALEDYQALGFKSREIAFQGDAAVGAMETMRRAGLSGVGMSSWGPAFFGFTTSHGLARSIAEQLADSSQFEAAWTSEASASGAEMSIDDGPWLPARSVVASDLAH